MKQLRAPGPIATAILLVAAGTALGIALTRRAPSAKTAMAGCDGEYADSLQSLAPRTREIEKGPRAEYTYLIRSTARYECPYFDADKKLRQRRVEAVEHGTAFAYEATDNETYLLTNEHVAAWPDVTEAARPVEGVHEGCKLLETKIHIVHDEKDIYEPGHVPLARIAADPPLDAAILKASQRLPALPYRIGKSAALRQGNAVQVRGFPLGLIHAVNSGKVVNPYDLDREQGWDHVDFVIDALLSEGNSGSPVLALSCKTGELQLVGMYHAGYKGHSALNVVVGIDQLRELMIKKRRVPRAPSEGSAMLAAGGRKKLREGLSASPVPIFEFGGLHLWVEAAGDALLYHVFGRGFPVDDRRIAVLEDRPAGTGFGEISRLWVHGQTGWRQWVGGDLGADERDLLVRLADAMRMRMLSVIAYRRALGSPESADERRRGRETLRTIERQTGPARELAGNLIDLVERLTPGKDSSLLASASTTTSATPAAAAPPPPAGTDAGLPPAPGPLALPRPPARGEP